MVMKIRWLTMCAALAFSLPCAYGQADKAYRVTDTVLDIEQGTTMFALVWQYYPEYKNTWLDVAADLAEANPHAFRRGDPGDVIVGERLALIEYTDVAREDEGAAATPAAATPTGRTAPAGIAPAPAPVQTTTSPTESQARAVATPNPERTLIGRVTALQGTLNALATDRNTRQIETGGNVYLGDRLLAGPDSSVTIGMIDEAIIELRADTQIVFEDYAYGSAGIRNHATITLLQGGTRIVTGAIAKETPDALFVNTPMATITAHPAHFSLQICASGKCRVADTARALLAGLYAGVLDGDLDIANNTGVRSLGGGEFVRVRNQGTESDPAIESAALLFEPALLAGLDIQSDEPLGFWAWLRERFF